MEKESDSSFTELGVRVSLLNRSKESAQNLKAKRVSTRQKPHSLYREFALATLSTLVQEKKKSYGADTQVSALDAYAGTGIASVQWKKHFQDNVHVTAADHEDVSLLQQNAESNSLECSPWKLDASRTPGDPREHQSGHEITSCVAEAKSLMTMEAFNFIYLTPHKSTGAHLEPAFHSVTIGGVLCLVVADLSVFARAPHVVRREFSAQVIKTEYLKELAARVVLGEAARSAAKYNKGISVLYVVSQEDFLLLAVRVCRGQKAIDSCLDHVTPLLHCRICEERTFLPTQLAPIEEPYSHLKCACKTSKIGKTAVILGPMWKGPIFSTEFLEQVAKQGRQLKLSAKFSEMIYLLLVESRCSSSDDSEKKVWTDLLEHSKLPHIDSSLPPQTKADSKCSPGNGDSGRNGQNIDNVENVVQTSSSSSHSQQQKSENSLPETDNPEGENHKVLLQGEKSAPESANPQRENHKVLLQSEKSAPESANPEGENHKVLLQSENSVPETDNPRNKVLQQKRKMPSVEGEHSEVSCVKKAKKDATEEVGPQDGVPFYYNIKKFKKTISQKLNKLVSVLRERGHRTSRTHFDPCAIRTSASVQEFLQILN